MTVEGNYNSKTTCRDFAQSSRSSTLKNRKKGRSFEGRDSVYIGKRKKRGRKNKHIQHIRLLFLSPSTINFAPTGPIKNPSTPQRSAQKTGLRDPPFVFFEYIDPYT